MVSKKRIAIVGAGPVGLEAALYGASLGHDVVVFERGRVGGNVREWGFVRLFSSWALNHSPLGARVLARAGLDAPPPDAYLTGAEYVERYLAPLAHLPPLEGRVREGARVVQVSRLGLGKKDRIGGPRNEAPFVLLVERSGGAEELVEADVVLDCSGTYGHHNWMGPGGIPALGERGLSDRIAYRLEDLAGRDRAKYEGRRVLLVGTGHSAATALDALVGLPAAEVVWVSRNGKAPPLPVIPNDPLPERARLSALANELAAGADGRVRFRPATEIEAVALAGDELEVVLRTDGLRETVRVDRILAHVGYHPDNRLYRELQVHECYASSGPMKLAAALLGEDGADCLAQVSKGPDVLKCPEPDFYILGAKSYGRNSSFLVRLGLEQVRDVYTLVAGDPALDLYGS